MGADVNFTYVGRRKRAAAIGVWTHKWSLACNKKAHTHHFPG